MDREPRNVASQIIEKILVNLRVISQLREGDKMDFSAQGNFVPMHPTYWTVASRTLKRMSRWDTLSKVQECVSSAEIMENHDNGIDKERVENALKLSIHGLRNLQLTYQDDVLFYQSIEVLLERISNRYHLSNKEMI